MQDDQLTIQNWVETIQTRIISDQPELLNLFNVYASEAVFSYERLSDSINALSPDPKIMEVGAGSLILSTYLARLGYQITALEPIGEGFTHFNLLQNTVLQIASELGIELEILPLPVEDISIVNMFDFIFSVNVMEHVKNVSVALSNITKALKVHGIYRFICPNYSFPYESHFNIPIIFSKKITRIAFNKKIQNSNMHDPEGTWRSLNWISVFQISQLSNEMKNIKLHFRKDIIKITFDRFENDKDFLARRSEKLVKLVRLLKKLRLDFIIKKFPVSFLPIIDCEVQKIKILK
jgi:2-polyprenyl-3-methyl-5-hydroxy-6-metoxy-1,4-benzoquinol methylase